LVLARVHYWLGRAESGARAGLRRASNVIEETGSIWLAKRSADYEQETGLSSSQVKRALVQLRESQLIDTQRRIFDRQFVLHLSPRWEPADVTRGVKVFANMAGMAGNGESAIVLAQIAYLLGTGDNGRARLGVRRHGFWWLAKSHQELASETGLGVRQVRSALDRLYQRDLIERTYHLFRGFRVLHVRFKNDVFNQRWREQADLRWERSLREDFR